MRRRCRKATSKRCADPLKKYGFVKLGRGAYRPFIGDEGLDGMRNAKWCWRFVASIWGNARKSAGVRFPVWDFQTSIARSRMTKISRFARNDDTGKALGAATVFSFHCLLHDGKDFGLLPPSSGRRCPEGAEVGSRSGMKSHVRQPVLPFRHPNPCFQTSPFPYGNPFGKRMTAILETFSNQRVTNHMRLRCYLQRGKRNGTTKGPG